MPLVVEDIDAVARRLGRPVLMVRFGRDTMDWLRNPTTKAKRDDFLQKLDGEGVTWTACGPPVESGWLSFLGDIYFDLAHTPGDTAYEHLRRMLEDDAGEPLDPAIRFCVYQELD